MISLRKALVVSFVIAVSIAPGFGSHATQSPAVDITFTCNQAPAKCQDLVQRISNSMGWNPGLGLTRQQLIRRETINWLRAHARQNAVSEAAATAGASAATTFNTDFPEPTP